MKEILDELVAHRPLTRDRASQLLFDIASGSYSANQVASLLTVYMMRTITPGEMQGFRDAMLALCLPVDLDFPVMDVCGTGGDARNTFNISTAASFVVAAAGQPVAKHGNYGVSSVSGSSNMLEYFGYKFTNSVDDLRRSLDRANICFMHAPLFHPAMKSVAPVRRELGVKTFFNMLGPMVNPARPKYQLVGVYSLALARLYAYLYQSTNKTFTILHTVDGHDEVSLTAPLKFFTNRGEYLWEPEDLGLECVPVAALAGGNTVPESAEIFLDVLSGTATNAQRQVVVANAAMALYTVAQEKGIEDAVLRATEALQSGKALEHFKKLMEV